MDAGFENEKGIKLDTGDIEKIKLMLSISYRMKSKKNLWIWI